MKKLFLTGLFFTVAIVSSFAQSDNAIIPESSKVIKGKLSNGLTYYVRHNEEPKDRASFYIIQNVGALLENDDQDGLAHFLEHMCFNGTKNFPKKGIIETMERHGVAFGKNINAYTAKQKTVYNISTVPTKDKTLLDTCLMVLHDWSNSLSLETEEIDAERGVISEEWRTRRSAQFRTSAQISPVLFKGSKYAIRDVIGSYDIINNFKPKTIRDYYHKWYRPDLQAIVVVGDFDTKEMVAKIKEIFGTIPAAVNPALRPSYSIPEHTETYYVCATDKENTTSAVSIITILPDKDNYVDSKTYGSIRASILRSFYNSMISSRMSEIMLKENPPFKGGSIGFSGLVRDYSSYSISAQAKPNEEAIAIKTSLIENERVKRFGFTEGELNRVKVNIMAQLEAGLKQVDKTASDDYVEGIMENFLEKDPIIEYKVYYDYIKNILPEITIEDVNNIAKIGNVKKNITIIVTGPKNVKHITKAELEKIILDVENDKSILAYKDQVSSGSFFKENLVGGKIVKTNPLKEFDAVEWTLSNGAKVIYKKADYEKDQVSMIAYSEGGTSLYENDMLPSADNTSSFTSAFGLGDYNSLELKKALTGKMASANVKISNRSESISGASITKDAETMFQLMYLRFTQPRFDKVLYKSIMSRNYGMLPALVDNPKKIMQDSIQMIMANYNPRVQLFNKDYLDKLSLENIEKIYKDRIKDASDFTFFIVGDINEDVLVPFVEKYIGSLKSENRKETWKDNNIRAPKGKVVKNIELALTTPKTSVITVFNKEMKVTRHNTICFSILKAVLDLRYTASLREKEGGTYGVGVQASTSKKPINKYTLVTQFDCQPQKADHLATLIFKGIDEIIKDGVTVEEISKSVKNQIKDHEQALPHNSYWMSVLTSYYIDDVNITDPKYFDKIINKISPKDIQGFAKKFFDKADTLEIFFRPKE